MKEKTKITSKGLFYNNKFLVVFSILVAVVLWSVVKVNYSEKITRTVSDVSISFDNILNDTEYIPFLSDDVTVNVTVSGKSYNISSNALTKDDIIVEPVNTFIDSTGYKYVTLSARFMDTATLSAAEILKVTPSSIKVFFDRQATDSFNVVARLTNDTDALSEDEYVVGQPVPSVNVMEISGPATVLSNIPNVYFEATVEEKDLPLTSSKEVPATVSFGLDNDELTKFLTYTQFDDDNAATVTIPVYVTKDVPTEVKFVGQPSVYSDEPPRYSVDPSTVTVSYNPQDVQLIESFSVGTIDFRTIDNRKNSFTFDVDEAMSANLTDKSIKEFTVTVDMSSMKSKSVETVPTKAVLSGKVDGYDYSVKIDNSFLNKIKIIGPADSVEKITADDLQTEINVSSIDVENEASKVIEISNISIQSPEAKDCWVFGSCSATVSVTKQ